MKQRPFLKWAGNKYRVLDKLIHLLPSGKRLIEPFVGSGAVFLNTNFKRYLLAETNPDLIRLYQLVKSDGDDFIAFAQTFLHTKNNTKKRYYQLRDTFNSTSDVWEKSALFIYLNRHGYNGLCRYNKDWEFNVPFGRYVHPRFPKEPLQKFQQHAQRARFVCQDFRKTMVKAKVGDIIYCDPPYVPLSTTANFTNYGAQCFTEADQWDLVSAAKDCQRRGVPVIISNHDTPFTRELYQQAKLEAISVARTISRNGSKRRPVKELIALYLPDAVK